MRAAALLSALLVGALSGCAASDRMVRALPFRGEGELPDADRVNVWPLYYQARDLVVVAWPLFDRDDEGFALRPLVAKDGSEWSVLYPLAGWNTESDAWWVLPAYNLPNNLGLAPLVNFGTWNHVGPAWWVKDGEGDLSGWGLAPLYGRTEELTHVGPVWWWKPGEEDEDGPWGIFPIAFFEERFGYFGSAWWVRDEDGGFIDLAVLPAFYYENDGGYKRLITPLGGRSWGGDGTRRFVNVLGPVFHHSTNGERVYTAVAWPVFAFEKEGEATDVRAFPLFRYRGGEDATSLSLLAGLIGRDRSGENRSFRLAPLVSHNKGMPGSFWDAATLYGYREVSPTNVSVHVGTPLLFQHRRSGADVEWSSLLNVLDYERRGDESSFSLLYYLYRQERKGEQVRRDFFPFFTWDSGPERSGFSFLWRVLRWETEGDETSGHALFVPWG